MDSPIIIHVDMDAFYAAVEVLDNPDLAGECVIVGGTSTRGVVCSASYEARALGVRSAMPIVKARRLCPGGVFLPVRRGRYSQASKQVFEIFRRFTPLVEPLSIDEAFLDVTASTGLFGDAASMGKLIRETIRKETGLTASAGIGPNKLIAKIASDLAKPDGLLAVSPRDSISFLDPLPISRLWGAGPAAVKKLKMLGAGTIGEARNLSREILDKNFGKFGVMVYNYSRGIDSRVVVPVTETKSIGNEITFDSNLVDMEVIHKHFLFIAEKVARRLRRSGLSGRTVSIKVKYADFKQVTRSATIDKPTDDSKVIYEKARELVKKTLAGSKPVRLLGVTASQLTGQGRAWQPGLFDEPEEDGKRKDLHQALDDICEKFGDKAVGPASLTSE